MNYTSSMAGKHAPLQPKAMPQKRTATLRRKRGPAPTPAPDTRARILDAAELLIQTRGYEGFSYRDIEELVGIRKASVHHHFPAKADLGVAVLQRFRANCRDALARISAETKSARARLEQYVGLFQSTIEDQGKMCLCGILASGYVTLPAEMASELHGAVTEHETWLAEVLRQGQATGETPSAIRPKESARNLFSALEGAMLLARLDGGAARFRSTAREITRPVLSAPQRGRRTP